MAGHKIGVVLLSSLMRKDKRGKCGLYILILDSTDFKLVRIFYRQIPLFFDLFVFNDVC